MLKEHQDQNQL
jgi:hypothetical protein